MAKRAFPIESPDFSLRQVREVIERSDRRIVLIPAELRRFDPLLLDAAVIAGGFAKGLHPLTENSPKPPLNVGDRSLLQRTVKPLKDSNIHRVSVAAHFLADGIKERLSDGDI